VSIQKKVCMLGAYAVGKTSLVRRFILSDFDEKYHVTIGVKTDKKVLTLGDREVMMMIWDIAGAEDHFTVPSSYLRGSAGVLLVIDGTRAQTLDRAIDLAEQIDSDLGKIPRVVLLNKADLTAEWQLDEQKIAGLSVLECPVLRSSAKTGENVEAAFRLLAERLVG
jgi:small GTP-binding protein